MSGSGSGSSSSAPVDENYVYYKYINTPAELGMSAGYNLSNVSDGVAGIVSYIELLVSGTSKASKTGQPLGNKYFLPTGQTCTGLDGSSQNMSLYIDNVPSGNLGIIPSGMGGNFSTFKGLLPGVLEDALSLAQINFFSAFTTTDPPQCQSVNLVTIDVNNNTSSASAYVSNDDIQNISPCNFVNSTNPVTQATCQQGFMVHDETRRRARRGRRYKNRELQQLQEIENKKNYRNRGQNILMPDDIFLKIFILSFGALWIYVALKLMANMYKKR